VRRETCFKQCKPTDLANAINGKPIICYNCGEPNHIAPQCPHCKGKFPKNNSNDTHQVSFADKVTADPDAKNELVCSARVVNYNNNSNEIQVEHDNSLMATAFPTGYYQEDTHLS
jgi:hypothetical protein